ncbi:UNVERIFIED_CONTAM: hypothetical protein Scaly_1907500 [Sesamum calycinum]|uniref:Retrovirus-related Pol polyprotein from transposon TNT 1-94-like beta-barrel domain-containing protein n=1 Tax=Sesamum calycinum TaxID=2727403 RepID=A0AAW2NFX0_9LAMI
MLAEGVHLVNQAYATWGHLNIDLGPIISSWSCPWVVSMFALGPYLPPWNRRLFVFEEGSFFLAFGGASCWGVPRKGYPGWWDPSKAPQKRNSKPNHHASVVVTELTNISKESNNHASVAIIESSDTGKVFHTYSPTNNSAWIIDSNATDHMTFDNNHVKSLKPSSQHIGSTGNGNPSSVAEEGMITTQYENGFAERKNRHLLEVVRASLFEAHMPTSYWGEVVTIAKYLINRMPSSSLQTPFDVLHKIVNSEPPRIKELPNRVTRGIPRVNYGPLLNSKTKNLINNFVFYHRLSRGNEALVNQLSTKSIPNSAQDVIRDPKWKEAINEEMKSLQKNSTWEIVDLP